MYRLIANSNHILKIQNDVLWIPNDLMNEDYQAYLAWLALGNEPEPAL